MGPNVGQECSGGDGTIPSDCESGIPVPGHPPLLLHGGPSECQRGVQ